MSTTRKYYIATMAIFIVGAILAVIGRDTVALIVFIVLAGMMGWIQTRVDRAMEERRPSDRPGRGK